jgi:hypothetical protein
MPSMRTSVVSPGSIGSRTGARARTTTSSDVARQATLLEIRLLVPTPVE